MTAYDSDPRVEVMVLHVLSGDGHHAKVWLRSDGRWVVSRSHATDADFATADEAIHSLIGDPA